MRARACHFTRRVETRQVSAAVEIGADAAHRVMRRGMNWSRLRAKIDSVIQTRLVNARKARLYECGAAMRQIQKHVRRAGGRHFRDDGARNHVARRQVRKRMVALHEALTGGVDQKCAFAAQRLRQQEARRAFHMQRRRMELHEFDIRNFRADAPSHGHAVSGSDGGIGGFQKHAAQTASGQQNGPRAYRNQLALRFLIYERSAHRAARHQQVDAGRVTLEAHIRQRRRFAVKRARNFLAGGIAVSVQHTIAAVRTFASECQAATLPIERRAPFDQFANGSGTVLDQRAHRGRIAQPVAGGDSVLLVELHAVIFGEGDGDAALSVRRGGFAQSVFGDHQHVSGLRQFDGRTQPGHARADDEEIRIHSQTSDFSIRAWYNSFMPSFAVKTPQRDYIAHVERGILHRVAEFVPERAGRIFVLSTEDVWKLHGHKLARGLGGAPHDVLILPGGEERKRLNQIEALAEEMVGKQADRSSVLIAFGGGITTDMGGFLAAIFMRGIPVIQIPTTLLAQVDAAIGGKTGVNLVAGKNLIGSFHQPLAVLIDPGVLDSLPDREYRAGLFEVIKCGVIRSEPLFRMLAERQRDVLAKHADVVDHLIAESVRIKAEVVSADERENGVRRILNFGHTFGHALEAETLYARYLHGEAVGFGMRAAAHLAEATGRLTAGEGTQIRAAIEKYGPIPASNGISAERLAARLTSDKKTIQGKVHFVLPERIGEVGVVSGIDDAAVLQAIRAALA